jgi:hypothetical protein
LKGKEVLTFNLATFIGTEFDPIPGSQTKFSIIDFLLGLDELKSLLLALFDQWSQVEKSFHKANSRPSTGIILPPSPPVSFSIPPAHSTRNS